MRLFMQVHNNLKLKPIQRGRVLAGQKGSGGGAEAGQGSVPLLLPAPQHLPPLYRGAQDAAGDMVDTRATLTHDPVSFT